MVSQFPISCQRFARYGHHHLVAGEPIEAHDHQERPSAIANHSFGVAGQRDGHFDRSGLQYEGVASGGDLSASAEETSIRYVGPSIRQPIYTFNITDYKLNIITDLQRASSIKLGIYKISQVKHTTTKIHISTLHI